MHRLGSGYADFFEQVAYDRKLRNQMNLSRQKCHEISQGNAALSEEALHYYAYTVLYEERRAGRFPAWEGVRIVRERVKET